MYVKFDFLNRRIAAYVRRVQKVSGLNSTLRDGKHAIFLDCDSCSERQLRAELAVWLERWNLPRADYHSTGRPDGWHVYVWCRLDIQTAIRYACDFPFCDAAHLVWSFRRRHFTLRISEKAGRSVDWQGYVDGPARRESSIDDFCSYVRYQTALHGE